MLLFYFWLRSGIVSVQWKFSSFFCVYLCTLGMLQDTCVCVMTVCVCVFKNSLLWFIFNYKHAWRFGLFSFLIFVIAGVCNELYF